MKSEDPRDSQQEYWNRNLDPQNLGTSSNLNRGLDRERPFYATPDQRYALEQLMPLPGKKILEIGCGLGLNTLQLAGMGATVVAMDIARDRLRAVANSIPGNMHQRVLLVQAAAEALPFKLSVFQGATSKSVLIHTKLPESVSEIHRVLAPHGSGIFIEPLPGNPLVNLYRRTLAPKEWQSIVTYFGERELGVFKSEFRDMHDRPFYWLGFLAFVWQFAIRIPALFWISLAITQVLDRWLLHLPYFQKTAWFTVISVRKHN